MMVVEPVHRHRLQGVPLVHSQKKKKNQPLKLNFNELVLTISFQVQMYERIFDDHHTDSSPSVPYSFSNVGDYNGQILPKTCTKSFENKITTKVLVIGWVVWFDGDECIYYIILCNFIAFYLNRYMTCLVVA